ncbi:hypothetical protein HUF18_08165 [Thalassolituus sp. ST750PaO-4]|uniref:hypothetical protein n=1 Tax=Thalassolituus sp. ST750PaO-4 TaxID=2742965 RepID=UPI001CE328CB|nr:hypothetical protein [Thalassolituus sp. ST750PaO-4]MCA6059744.1 hypothetical protein [Thalassolituus sp. ST750PaO-4]
MQFQMPVTLIGGMSFQTDKGDRINQLFVINTDPTNSIYRGYVPAKMSCDQAIVDSLSNNPADYPMNVTLIVLNKTQGGKTVQHALSIVREPAKKAG